MTAEPAIKIDDLETRALSLPDQARTIKIVTAQDYERAGEFLLTVKDLRKEIKATFGPLKDKAWAAHKAICAEEERHDKPLKEAEATVKPLMKAWDDEQERIRLERERLLNEEARKREEERILAEAAAAEAAGDKETAQDIINEEPYVPPTVLKKATPKVAGISYRETWKFRVVDEKKIRRELMIPDEVKIGQLVRALKGQFNEPGIEAYKEKEVAAGRR